MIVDSVGSKKNIQTSSPIGLSQDTNPRVKIEQLGLPNPISLNERELDSSSKNDGQAVIGAVHYLAKRELDILNAILPKNETIVVLEYEKLGIEALIWKLAEGYMKVYKYKLKDRLDSHYADITVNFDTYNTRELCMNGQVCLNTLITIFMHYFEYRSEKNTFMESVYKTLDVDPVIIENVEILLNQAIDGLEKRIEKNYIVLFKINMNPDLNCEKKYNLMLPYFVDDTYGLELPKLDVEGFQDQLLTLTNNDIRNRANDFIKLQILLDCFKEMKKLPKTFKNVSAVYLVLKNILNYLQKEKNYICAYLEVDNKAVKITRDMCKKPALYCYYEYYLEQYVYLSELGNQFNRLIQNTYSKILSSFDEPIHSSAIQPKKVKSKKKKKPRAKNVLENKENAIKPETKRVRDVKKEDLPKNATNNQKKTSIPQIEKPIETKTKNLEQYKLQIETQEESSSMNSKQIQTTMPSLQFEKEEKPIETLTDVPKINVVNGPALYIETTPVEEVEKEVNFLMQIMLDVCVNDHIEKRQNALQAKTKTIVPLDENLRNLEIKPQVKKLNGCNMSTLKTVLCGGSQETVTGFNFETLVKALDGRVVGPGNGTYKVFFGKSKKKAGKYEVHGNHNQSMSPQWTKRAGDSIYEGWAHGTVVLDAECELLMRQYLKNKLS